MKRKLIRKKRLLKQSHVEKKTIIFVNKYRKPKKEIVEKIIKQQLSILSYSWIERFKSLFIK